mgnify:CR=1 FL=1
MIKLNTTDIIKENKEPKKNQLKQETCLLYTSDAADE